MNAVVEDGILDVPLLVHGRVMRALTMHEFQCSVIAALELRRPL